MLKSEQRRQRLAEIMWRGIARLQRTRELQIRASVVATEADKRLNQSADLASDDEPSQAEMQESSVSLHRTR
jgi:hypothetical protein